MNFRAVLFDFDGTLTPSLPLWVKAYEIALDGLGVRVPREEIVERCFFRDWSDAAASVGVASPEALRVAVEHGLLEAFREAVLFPLALPLIHHCREQGMQVALVTSSPRSMIAHVLPRLELHERFDFVICGGDVVNYKPHPEPVLTTLRALGRRADEAIMVGDSRADILAGKAAGTTTALFLPDDHTQFHSTEALHACGPDHVFSDHVELPALLGLPALPVQ